jgi:hypothetical protein
MSPHSEYDVRISAVPHDLLKVAHWREHNGNRGLFHIPIDIKNKCPQLIDAIKKHHETLSWRTADRLASAISRLRMTHEYWMEAGKNPFLVKVYGEEPVIWSQEAREKLQERVFEVYRELGESEEANAWVNSLLMDFPQDSRFPMVGLATHHQLTWILKKRVEEGGGVEPEEVYLIVASIPEPEFHRLRERREFHERRRQVIRRLFDGLSQWDPLRVGDDLIIVLTSSKSLEELKEKLIKMKASCDVDVYRYYVEKVQAKKRRLFRITGYDASFLSIGGEERWDYSQRDYTKWIHYMEDYPFVAWISVTTRQNLQDSAGYFLCWAEENVLSRMQRKEEEEPLQSDVPACPELMLNVAIGYNEFLRELAKAIHPKDPEGITILRSFSRSLFLYGLKDRDHSLELYWRVANVKKRLHIPVDLAVVVTKPDHPFWHVASFFKESGLIILAGGKVVKLSDMEVQLARDVRRSLQGVSRTTFHNIIRRSKNKETNIEELKFWIEGLAEDEKIERETAQKLCTLINRLASGRPEEEGKEVISKVLRMLAPFAKRGQSS